MEKRTRYQVLVVNEWVNCTKATQEKPGWLHYELADGTNGLTYQPKWRVRPEASENKIASD